MKPILEIHGISKKFHIHHERQSYLSIRDNIASVFKRKAGKMDEDFWALKNVSFEVNQGECIGIIGRNGAGKSTLLKILSKITPPTSGKIISRGRIASLLEVGTGFHAELSGRENIFLNGSILGMGRKEIERKFDEIIDFSGVRKFIDTPLKHYSSGMQLRLAFAVAAFLEPEILIIDEVLAVGDNEFQKKCLGKMNDISQSGRTIIFVSHNMTQVLSLCQNAILLDNGKIISQGKSKDIINEYTNTNNQLIKTRKHYTDADKMGDDIARLCSVRIIDDEKNEITSLPLINQKIGIEIYYLVLKDGYMVLPNIDLLTDKGDYVFPSIYIEKTEISAGYHTFIAWIDPNMLNNIYYVIGVGLSSFNVTPLLTHCYDKDSIRIELGDDLEAPTHRVYKGRYGGLMRPLLKWERTKANSGQE